MAIKYYTHFLLQERSPRFVNEFRGVVEVNQALPGSDTKQAASLLARKMDCESRDIRILQWSRLH